MVISVEEHILRRLIYVRRLYLHGVEHAGDATQIDLALGVLNFDNAIEMLLYIIAEHLGLTTRNTLFQFMNTNIVKV